tara:strand:+ start:156 stop:533 length:378 start_codon:yes stop_codon:yes gene_type:complete
MTEKQSVTYEMHDVLTAIETQRDSGKASYRDFEGMADPARIRDYCWEPKSETWCWDMVCDKDENPMVRRMVRDIALNIVFEQLDTSGNSSWEEAFMICYTIRELLTVRHWSPVSDEDVTKYITGK